MDAITIGLDISKSVFQVHAVDATGAVVLRRRLTRAQMLPFFLAHPPAVVGLEACGGSQHWARELERLGHTVRLMSARAVKAYLPRQKNDAADAAAICEAAGRIGVVRAVPVKSTESQAALALLGVRDLLIKQRTMLINALRGHLAEFGLVARQGRQGVAELRLCLDEAGLPDAARAACMALVSALDGLEAEVLALEVRLRERHRSDARAQELAAIPGIGMLGAAALSAGSAPEAFHSARDYAASLGLVPRQSSTGGKERLGAISKMGDQRARRLLVLGACALLKRLRPRQGVPPAALAGSALGAWALRLAERKPWRLVMVALANKLARIAWAVMTRGAGYRSQGGSALAAQAA